MKKKENPWKLLFKAVNAVLVFAFIIIFLLCLCVGIDNFKDGEFFSSFKMFLFAFVSAAAVFMGFFYPVKEKLTFKVQALLGITVLPFAFLFARILNNSLFLNVAWIMYGVLFLVNPVYPPKYSCLGEKRCRKEARIAGIICIILGMIIKFGFDSY